MKKDIFPKIKKELAGIQKDVSLGKYTTFKIGGKAKYFYIAKNKENLIGAIKVAKKIKIPFFILGGGSNLLVADRGFEGLVIKMQNVKIKIQNENSKCKIFCGAGTPLSLVVSEAAKNNLVGLEWAVGIPGTVGGAICGNAGAFGSSIKDVIKTVTVLEIKNQESKIKNFKKEECNFSYRNSVFKKDPNLIIISTIFQLKKGDRKKIKEKMKEYLKYRQKTQPLEYPSVGSIFKNVNCQMLNVKILKKLLEFKRFEKMEEIPAGWLIEKCGLKGKKIGNVKISEKHANFIVNLGKGKAKDVVALINLVKREVKKRFSINLELEICLLGF